MAFSSANIESISMGLSGVAVGAADRCVPFLNKELTGMSIADSQDAFEELREEQVASRSSDAMDWELTSEYVVPIIPAKVNPFLGAKAASQPIKPVVTAKVNPFLDAPAVSKPVNPFLSQPAASNLPVEMDIDEWSINDQTNTNANTQPARNNKRNNQRQSKGRGKATKSNKGGSNNASQKHKGGDAGFLGNYKITKPTGGRRQNNDNSNSETRRGGNNNNSSRRRSNNGNKNRSQRQ
ncbi:hypothetical protein PG985_000206 [Apiospora marii]|uniref:Uncharacterized protein n=1 Tax=Apiospora marii TaxID=335849 RepID=A0ABR1R1D1_9PEZI